MPDQTLEFLLPTQEQVAARVAEIKAWSQKPLFLYGAGVYSNEVRAFLRSLGLAVGESVVDCDFVTPGVEAVTSEEFKKQTGRGRLIVGFLDSPPVAYEKARAVTHGMDMSVDFIDCRRWEEFLPWRTDVSSLIEKLGTIYDHLSDDESRRTMAAFVTSKLLLDPWPVAEVQVEGQYFPRDLRQFHPRSDDVFVDGGAYTGDTLVDYVSMLGGEPKEYWAFEPDPMSRERLVATVRGLGIRSVHVEDRALWSRSGSVSFEHLGVSSSHVNEQGTVRATTIALDDLGLDPTAMKLDIEGAELAAIEGAADTIRQSRPRLAIAVYHRSADLYLIPNMLLRLHGGYRIYLRYHGSYGEELVLYALPDSEV